jgi:MFS transporter, DHA1 family, multidrug resistance protein
MPEDPEKRRGLLVILAVLSAIAPAALHMPIPSLPLLARVFDKSAAAAELVLTLFLVGIAAGQLVYGPFSDRFGRRPVLLAGLILFLLGSVACGFAPSLFVLLWGRVLEALGGCAGIVLGRAIIRDLYDRERATSAIAAVTMAMTLAPSVAPAIGAYLALWVSWRADFALLAAIGAAALLLTATRLPESNADPVPFNLGEMAGSFLLLLRSPAFLGFCFASAFTSASWFTFTASAPYLLNEILHQPISTYGLMILLPMGGYILGNAVAARSALFFGSSALFLAGLALSLASGGMLALWSLGAALSPWSMFVPMTLSSIGNGLSQPPAIAAGLSIYPRLAGAASGMIGFLQMGIAALGTLLVGHLPQNTGLPMIVVVSLFMLLAFLCGLFALKAPAAPDWAAALPETSRPRPRLIGGVPFE